MSPTGRKKDSKGKKYERRDDRDVFTNFRWNGTIAGPTRIIPARDQLAKHSRERMKALLHEQPPRILMHNDAPLRVVVCGDDATFARAFRALHELDLADSGETAPRYSARAKASPAAVAIASSKTSVLCVRFEGELLEIAANGHVDLLLINPDRFKQQNVSWVYRDVRLTAEDGYPPALVVLEDDDPDPDAFPPEFYGMFVGSIRESAPIKDWVDVVRRAPARRVTRLLGEEGGRRARGCGLVDGPFANALSALFFDIAQLMPFKPARDAGKTLAALTVDDIEWRPDRPLREPTLLNPRAMESARKHLARRLTRLGLPSANTVVTLVRVAYAVAIARSWHVSERDAARYAGFRTSRQLMNACPRVGGASFSLLVERLDFGVLPFHFAVMLFRDDWNDSHDRFEWTFLDIRLRPPQIVVDVPLGTEVIIRVLPDQYPPPKRDT